MTSYELRNQRAVQQRLDLLAGLPAALQRELESALDKEALRVQGEAVKLAPVREGVLRQNATTTVEVDEKVVTATVEFGGLAEAYAEVQHERTDFHHDDGQAHFLYGDESSAWEKTQATVLSNLERQATAIGKRRTEGGA